MKILSIDTASNICGVSILENSKLIKQLDSNTGRTHSENLMPIVQNLLSELNLSVKDFDLLVCDKGPGSFTGIRIGVATVKAFHDSLNIPCIGISSLESLAYNSRDFLNENDLVCSIIDCKNNNCYFALYSKCNNYFECLIEPQAEEIISSLSILKSYLEDNFNDFNITFVGDGSEIFKKIISSTFSNANFLDANLNNLNSYSLALAGLRYYENNIYSDILPMYLKKPQAQRELEEKNTIKN